MTSFAEEKEQILTKEDEILKNKKKIIEETSRHPVVITVEKENCILYEKNGVIEISSAKVFLPAFKDFEELTTIISKME